MALGIGYFDSENDPPTIDETTVCLLCGQPTGNPQRPSLLYSLFTPRWPLATFFRIHADEYVSIASEGDSATMLELIAMALERRAQCEESRTNVPDAFRAAFGGSGA